jgi:hypothetical protein
VGRFACAIFRHFSGFEFFLLPSRIHSRPNDGQGKPLADSLIAMNKTSTILWALVICFVLAACIGQDEQPLLLPANTPKPPNTLTPSSTRTPIVTETSAPSYPLKQVFLDYTIGGFHTPFDLYYADYGDAWSELVLYTDGQLIIPGKTFQQKLLSKEEIDQLFSQLDSFGFFSLTRDNLYNFGNQEPPRVFDGIVYCVIATGERKQNLCTYEPHESFLVPEMKKVLQFLSNYQPKEMTPYYPDRILLWVQIGRNPYAENLPEKAVLWNENFPNLETPDEKIVYAEGNIAKEIFALFNNEVSTIVISQNDLEYTVSIDIVMPHEQLQLQP